MRQAETIAYIYALAKQSLSSGMSHEKALRLIAESIERNFMGGMKGQLKS